MRRERVEAPSEETEEEEKEEEGEDDVDSQSEVSQDGNHQMDLRRKQLVTIGHWLWMVTLVALLTGRAVRSGPTFC